MAKTNGRNGRNEEIDADRFIRNYEESNQILPEPDEDDDQARLNHFEPSEAPSEAIVTGGDIDADWSEASLGRDEVSDESNQTLDQDIVDEIGKAMGVTYQDAEPLRPEEKIVKRDQERWELNPVSSEDYEERQTNEEGP